HRPQEGPPLRHPGLRHRLRPGRHAFVWDQLVTIWQVIGRLVRGGVPARVVFVDAAFAPQLAASQAPFTGQGPRPRRSKDPGLLVRLRDVLAPYFAPEGNDTQDTHTRPADAALVTLLYRPLYEALCIMNTPSTSARNTD
ncbi:hypothetical protein ABZ136_23285, partial [Streptomyces microflavus]|uniref:hypothetical protein n=1 Tax=Streptomyces microflavus TaxID=1919 RepID=UPI0033B16291